MIKPNQAIQSRSQPKSSNEQLRLTGKRDLVLCPASGIAHINGTEPNIPVITMRNCRNITIDGLSIGHDCEETVSLEVDITESDSITISNCKIAGRATQGIRVAKSRALTLRDCAIHDFGTGVALRDVKNARLVNCRFWGNDYYYGCADWKTGGSTTLEIDSMNRVFPDGSAVPAVWIEKLAKEGLAPYFPESPGVLVGNFAGGDEPQTAILARYLQPPASSPSATQAPHKGDSSDSTQLTVALFRSRQTAGGMRQIQLDVQRNFPWEHVKGVRAGGTAALDSIAVEYNTENDLVKGVVYMNHTGRLQLKIRN